MSLPTIEGKRVYFYDSKRNKLGYHTITDPTQRYTFPIQFGDTNSSEISTVTSDMDIILQPTTFIYGYANAGDENPIFTASGSFVAQSVNSVNAINTFIPSKVGINAIEFHYYNPDNWIKFCQNRSNFNTNSGCSYMSGNVVNTIESTNSGNTNNTNPGNQYPNLPHYINESPTVTEKNISNMMLFIIIFCGVLIVVSVTFSAMYSFNFFGKPEVVEYDENEQSYDTNT